MKTIKELADDIGVSKTAIFKKLTPELRAEYTKTVSGVIQVSPEGETLIRQGFKHKNEPQTKQDNLQTEDAEDLERYTCSKETYDMFNAVLETLQKQLTAKDEQLAAKDKQLAVRDEQITKLASNLEIAQTNLQNAQTLNVSIIARQVEVGLARLARIEAFATQRNSFLSRFPWRQRRVKKLVEEPDTKKSLFGRIFGRQNYRAGQQCT